MVFSSLYFIFIFLPVVCGVYYLLKLIFPGKIFVRNVFLCLSSLFFYAWGEPVYIFLMLISILCNYFFALGLNGSANVEKSSGFKSDFSEKKTSDCKNDFCPAKKNRILFVVSVIFNLGFLVFFKYSGFFAVNLNAVFKLNLTVPKFALPIGISFYTFQALSYVIDVYRGKVPPQKNLLNLALYISLFPQLIAGPIVRYVEIDRELDGRKESFEGFTAGLCDFMTGLGAKVLLANNLAVVVDGIYSNFESAGAGILWLTALCYALQIYFDFSGYSRMAIGLGKMFGFSFPQNFNYPYCACSITDFWRRWHITLSQWFRDYVYIPLGGNRVVPVRHIFNILITWLLTGFWHGASLNFLLWGIYYGVLLVFEKYITLPLIKKTELHKVLNSCLRILLRICSLFLILFGWILFRVESLNDLAFVFKKMFTFGIEKASGGGSSGFIEYIVSHADVCSKIFFVIPAVVFSLPVYKWIFGRAEESKVLLTLKYIFAFVIFALCLCFLVAATYNPFIYFRF